MKHVLLSVGGALLLIGSGASGVAYAADPENAVNICVTNGGKVITRMPVYNTGDQPQNWLYLMGEQKFCEFTSATDGSQIHITLETLNTTKPSLAALAYYSRLLPIPRPGSTNPSSEYCTQLGGSDLFGGINAAGGGWVNTNAKVVVLHTCVFPDMSSIDSWGLFYNAFHIVVGIDLTTVLKFHP